MSEEHNVQDDDWGDFDLDDIYTTEETSKEEDQRHAGLGMTGSGAGLWYMMMLGKQVFQFVPHRYIRADGSPAWDWRAVYHVHQPGDRDQKTMISAVDEALEQALKEEFPGWQYVCRRETFGGECKVCNLKWDVGRWFKDNTKQGWKHPACKAFMTGNGMYTKRRVLSWILPLSHAGDWLQNTEEGRRWAEDERNRLQSGKSAKKAMDNFQRGYQEAIKQAARYTNQDPEPVLTILSKDLYEIISRSSSSDMYGENAAGRVKNAMQFVVEINIDPDTGNRKFIVNVHPNRRHLVETKDGKPDSKGIMEMVKGARNLREYREYVSEALNGAIDRRVSLLDQESRTIMEELQNMPEPTPSGPESSGSYAQSKPASKSKSKPAPQTEAKVNPVETPKTEASKTYGGLQVEPTKELGSSGMPLCYGQGLQDPMHPICRKCAFEDDCEEPASEEAEGDDAPDVEAPF